MRPAVLKVDRLKVGRSAGWRAVVGCRNSLRPTAYATRDVRIPELRHPYVLNTERPNHSVGEDRPELKLYYEAVRLLEHEPRGQPGRRRLRGPYHHPWHLER